MGEIMRWRLTRAAQRRVPAPESLLQLPGLSGITPAALNAMVQAVQANGPVANNPTLTSYSAIVASPTALRQYLSTPARGGARGPAPSSPAPTVIQEVLNLLVPPASQVGELEMHRATILSIEFKPIDPQLLTNVFQLAFAAALPPAQIAI